MLVRIPRLSRHHIRRPLFQQDLVRGGATLIGAARDLSRADVRTQPHAARREKRYAGRDAVLRCIAMPADGRTRRVLVDQCHRERFGIDAGPGRDLVSQRTQKSRNRRRDALCVVGVAEERNPPASDDTAHLERRELDARELGDQGRFFLGRDEAALIPKAVWYVCLEERGLRTCHTSVWHVPPLISHVLNRR